MKRILLITAIAFLIACHDNESKAKADAVLKTDTTAAIKKDTAHKPPIDSANLKK